MLALITYLLDYAYNPDYKPWEGDAVLVSEQPLGALREVGKTHSSTTASKAQPEP